ncbi:Uncharacterized protein M6B38_229735 [Iris pallida]|uniref:Uncharacterized protein n=1 Tax=Iris pallida TaxID=29817 RepID=A0AAX6DSQ5_IRIPA|nr:Uncharacterized protein M6B38_229735 [Iris pallida]
MSDPSYSNFTNTVNACVRPGHD